MFPHSLRKCLMPSIANALIKPETSIVTCVRLVRFQRKPVNVIYHGSMAKAKSPREYYEHVTERPDKGLKTLLESSEDAKELEKMMYKQQQKLNPKKPKKEAKKAKKLENEGRENEENLTAEEVIEKFKKPKIAAQIKLPGLCPIMFKNDRHTVDLIRNAKSLRSRERSDSFLVEGWRILQDAMVAGLRPKAIFYTRTNLLARMSSKLAKDLEEFTTYMNSLPIIKTPYKKMQTWSSLETSPGIMAIFSLEEAKALCRTPKKVLTPVTVIVDGVIQPSNIGGILRTVACAGVQKVFFMEYCCDAWDSRCIRASSGAHFALDFETQVEWRGLVSKLPSNPRVFLANACQPKFPEDDYDPLTRPNRPPRYTHDERQAFLSEYLKQDRQEILDEDESYDDDELLSKFEGMSLPSYSYDEVNFYATDDPLVLVIGGEKGFSNSAIKFAVDNSGAEISIPMQDHVNSLNSNVACGIFVYEMMKQALKLKK